MDSVNKKPVIGILGGIASGKSTVAAEFAKLGCAVVDADKIAHELLEEPSIKEKIIATFGTDILEPEGKISRERLGKIVFADSAKLSRLTEILHPEVLKRIDQQVQQLQEDTTIKAIVIDMALLVEVGWDKRCDRLIFVDCDEKTRLERAYKNKFLSPEQVKIRENFQISLDKKASIAENIIDNNSDLSALAKQVAGIFPFIIK